ncbi:MAG: UDP-3-O-(3-hydroxymyristoyl)glucosamine N-acyltransferase [Deltaproteobacteria bacterium]|nr:UDP-3-O-(3-hydroxymyristoyl)glucosamine N-acyltransferase [Deltaproteobacteria bacterium]
MKRYTLEELAVHLGGEPSERPGPEIEGVRPLEYAGKTDITYVSHVGFLAKLNQSAAGAVLLPFGLDSGDRPFIRAKNPEVAFARLTELYYGYPRPPHGVSPRADVHLEALLGAEVYVGPFAVVGRGARIGDRSVVAPHVVIGEDVQIGAGTWIFPHVTIYPGVTIGERVIIHAGSVIGADGFGFVRDSSESGTVMNVKKYHSGAVEIGNDVEIGALCAIDRALAGITRLGDGVKLDNQVQIAHSVQIGEGTVIAAQVGIAGSSSVGRLGVIAGQVGIADHLKVGNHVMLAAQAGVYRDVPDGSILSGAIPAMPVNQFRRVQSWFKKLPELVERIRKLERLVQPSSKES